MAQARRREGRASRRIRCAGPNDPKIAVRNAGLPVSEIGGTRSRLAVRNRASSGAPEASRQVGSFGLTCGRLGNKKPGRDAGLFVFLPTHSAEDAGRVDDSGCRKQPKGDQNKFHDLPPSRLQYSSGLSGRNAFFYGPLTGRGARLSAGSSQSAGADELSDHPLAPKPAAHT